MTTTLSLGSLMAEKTSGIQSYHHDLNVRYEKKKLKIYRATRP
jgi:hypothetical protein